MRGSIERFKSSCCRVEAWAISMPRFSLLNGYVTIRIDSGMYD